MMTFYAAAGSYQIRSEDGKNMPYIMRLGKLQPVSIPEFSLWSIQKVVTSPTGEGHVIPLLEGDILGPKEYREGIHRLPFFIYTDCRKLCWPVVSMAICNPLHIDQNIHLCHLSFVRPIGLWP